MNKKLKIIIAIVIVIIIAIISILWFNSDDTELKSVKSNKNSLKIYEEKEDLSENIFVQDLTIPFSLRYNGGFFSTRKVVDEAGVKMSTQDISIDNVNIAPETSAGSKVENTTSVSKDYSKTNIQVEYVKKRTNKF